MIEKKNPRKKRNTLFIFALILGIAMTAGVKVFWPNRYSHWFISNGVNGPPGMVWIPGNRFEMGTDNSMAPAEERPAHHVILSGFWIDQHDVTNAEFARFIAETGYMTTAERAISQEEIKAHLPSGSPAPTANLLAAGGLVFKGTPTPVDLRDFGQWWRFVPGASWKHPEGPQSSIHGKQQHPVVQVSFEDAQAYAKWVGKQLPTEAEWEYAARGGLVQSDFSWGNDTSSRGRFANLWNDRGAVFPIVSSNLKKPGTTPVGHFPPNGYGLYDMTGNVWQWVGDRFSTTYFSQQKETSSTDPVGPDEDLAHPPVRTIRGGSFLCSETYCTGYRISARQGNDPSTSTNNLGFRLVMTDDAWKKARQQK
jgi:formylglycine-generating enzyme